MYRECSWRGIKLKITEVKVKILNSTTEKLKALYSITVDKKQKGYDPENNDWYYEMRGPAGKLMPKPEPGKINMCIGCHAAAKSKDRLAGTEIR